jgi:hypothetical protein
MMYTGRRRGASLPMTAGLVLAPPAPSCVHHGFPYGPDLRSVKRGDSARGMTNGGE